MRRKSFLFAGLTLSIVYAVLVVATFCLLTIALASTMLDTVEIASDIMNAILRPFKASGNTMMIVILSGMAIVFVYLIIASTRFSKYSKLEKNILETRKLISVVYLISFIIATILYIVVFVSNMGYGFSNDLIINVALLVTIVAHIISIIALLIGMIKEFLIRAAPTAEQQASQVQSLRPPIYTAGLDEEDNVNEGNEQKVEQVEKPKQELKESESSKKLVESIGKLDQMRKDGAISAKEYTRLRAQLIRNYSSSQK